jgi:pimeloyl-ACP methyl ester carboxylesterase
MPLDSRDSVPAMTTRELAWSWHGHDVVLGIDEAGDGAPVLLLPALSSISTRAEMHPLMALLARQFRVVALDWPGFGTAARPSVSCTPDALSAFLHNALQRLPRPHAVVAAGHAAAYVIHHAADAKGFTDRLVLLAPTWRGPLPTMTGGQRPWFGKIRGLIALPAFGPLLYRLNVSGFVVRRMVAGHVYSDPAWLAGERLVQKRKVTEGKGARFASVAFVTGGLDRFASRGEFLDLAARAGIPILLIRGDETPPRSLAEMEALAKLPGVETARIPRGKLSVYEEFPDLVAAAMEPFLAAP